MFYWCHYINIIDILHSFQTLGGGMNNRQQLPPAVKDSGTLLMELRKIKSLLYVPALFQFFTYVGCNAKHKICV